MSTDTRNGVTGVPTTTSPGALGASAAHARAAPSTKRPPRQADLCTGASCELLLSSPEFMDLFMQFLLSCSLIVSFSCFGH
jgi:hypothetical protein